MASFLSGLLGSYASGMLEKHRNERAEQDKKIDAQVSVLKEAVASGKLDDASLASAFEQMQELTQQKGSKKGGFSFSNLLGKFKDTQQTSAGGAKQPQSAGSPASTPTQGQGQRAGAPPQASQAKLPAVPSPLKFRTPKERGEAELSAQKPLLDYQHQLKMEELAEKPPTTLEAQWLKSFRAAHEGQDPTPEQIDAHYKAEREKPIDGLVAQGIEAAKNGSLDEAKRLFGVATDAATAKKGTPTTGTTVLGMIHKANEGDAKAQQDLKTYLAMQKEMASAKGMAFGSGRAMYQIGAYIDGTEGSPTQGQMIPLSNYDAIQRIRAGQNLVPSGRLPAATTLGAQRLVKEATPAIKAVRENLKAYDNSEDRAIFARVMTSAGKPAYGQESTWLGNILNQAATEKLSPEGKRLIVRLGRLNETIGTLRQTLGAPATDNSMALMLGLLPGPSTPDSSMAKDMIDQLEQNVTNAIEIPTIKGVSGKGALSDVPNRNDKKSTDDPMSRLREKYLQPH